MSCNDEDRDIIREMMAGVGSSRLRELTDREPADLVLPELDYEAQLIAIKRSLNLAGPRAGSRGRPRAAIHGSSTCLGIS